MTEVIENIPTGIRWDSGQMDEDFEGGNNSAKLFERSRIKALAGMHNKQRKSEKHSDTVNSRYLDFVYLE